MILLLVYKKVNKAQKLPANVSRLKHKGMDLFYDRVTESVPLLKDVYLHDVGYLLPLVLAGVGAGGVVGAGVEDHDGTFRSVLLRDEEEEEEGQDELKNTKSKRFATPNPSILFLNILEPVLIF